MITCEKSFLFLKLFFAHNSLNINFTQKILFCNHIWKVFFFISFLIFSYFYFFEYFYFFRFFNFWNRQSLITFKFMRKRTICDHMWIINFCFENSFFAHIFVNINFMHKKTIFLWSHVINHFSLITPIISTLRKKGRYFVIIC